MPGTTTLESHVREEQGRGLAEGAAAALLDVAAGVKRIAAVLARAVICGAVAASDCDDDPQRRIGGLVNDLLVGTCVGGGHVAAVASSDAAEPRVAFNRHASPFLLAVDSLDGGSNLCVNATVGTIFSVLPQRGQAPLGAGAFLQAGAAQLCAGYAVYGPCTMLVVTSGHGVAGFALDAAGRFVLTHPELRIPDDAREFAVDASTARHWTRPVRRYVDECVAGRSGPRRADFDMRWVGSTVAEVHRVLVRGGTLLYPDGAEGAAGAGRLKLVFEANPMALLVEQAGGGASTGSRRVLDLVPRELHERVPAFLGSRQEVDRVVSFHADPEGPDDRPYTSPLFNVRSLLRES